MAKIDFVGLDEFYKWTDGAIKNVDSEVQNAISKGAYMIEGSAKRNAPVDTGRLRDSINSSIEEGRAEIGTNVEYAPHVHEGARGRTPRPFLKQAYAENKDKIIQEVQRAAERSLD